MANLRLLGPMQFASLSEAPLTLLRILQRVTPLSLTKFLVDQIDKNVAMATSK